MQPATKKTGLPLFMYDTERAYKQGLERIVNYVVFLPALRLRPTRVYFYVVLLRGTRAKFPF